MSALTRLTLKYCNLDDFVVNKAPHLSLILLASTSEFPLNVLDNTIGTNPSIFAVHTGHKSLDGSGQQYFDNYW